MGCRRYQSQRLWGGEEVGPRRCRPGQKAQTAGAPSAAGDRRMCRDSKGGDVGSQGGGALRPGGQARAGPRPCTRRSSPLGLPVPSVVAGQEIQQRQGTARAARARPGGSHNVQPARPMVAGLVSAVAESNTGGHWATSWGPSRGHCRGGATAAAAGAAAPSPPRPRWDGAAMPGAAAEVA
jgi:hypothetical protein